MRLPRSHPGRHAGPREKAGMPGLQVLLPEPRPERPLRGHVGRAVVTTLAWTLVAAAVLVGLANVTTPANITPGPSATPSASPAQVALMRRFDCSQDGFGDGIQPKSAIIREDGGLRVVSFDRGWQVYTGDRPRALVAVCHALPR